MLWQIAFIVKKYSQRYLSMMYLRAILLFFMNVSLFLAAPISKDDAEAEIVKNENTNDGSGNYHFSYETSNGISREETGTLVNADQPDAHIEVRGTVSYLDPNGDVVSLRYAADDKGYRVLAPDDVFSNPVLKQEVSPLIVASLLGG